MLEMLLSILKLNFCTHSHVETNKAFSYCPDCGKLIHINWYVIRCACCGKKRIGIIKYGRPVPVAHFCTNCGSEEYEIEKIDNLNYFNMNYAVAKKEEEDIYPTKEVTETWVDEVEILKSLRYLPLHLN